MSVLLKTERLTLRKPCREDLAALVPLIGDYAVAKNLAAVPHPYTAADAESWLDGMTERRAADGDDWAILRSGMFTGICSVTRYQGRLSLGYWLGKSFWGMGYATEAAEAAVSYAFAAHDVFALVSGYFVDNPASGRVLEKLGFEPAGIELVRCVSRGTTVACNRVLLLREQFVQKKAA
jgi:RimJ/RimL family protein N-acetyltransferase